MSKKKKKPIVFADNKKTKRKKSYKSQIMIGSVTGVLVVAAVIVLAIVFSNNPNAELTNKTWRSYEAYNSSNEQVELQEVYNNRYTTYQGRLEFKNDGIFEIWLTAGDINDGTHTGTYTYNGEVIRVKYSSGEETEFKAVKDGDGNILYIDVPYTNDYDTYNVYFN